MDSAYAAAYPELYRRHWWWRVREEILIARISALFDARSRPLRILDVGCGAGLFFDALHRLGDVEGIESDPIALEQAGNWRSHIFHGQLDASFTPATPYDAVLLLDVLEHLRDPVQLLRNSARVLAPGGRVVITVPAFNWLWTRHDDLNQHVHRYTAGEVRRIAAAAGLAIEDSTYLFQSLILPKAAVRVLESVRNAPPRVPGIPPEPLNSILKQWLRIEYAVARWLPFGGSLLAVAAQRDSQERAQRPAAAPAAAPYNHRT